MNAKLGNFSEISKLLSVKSKMSGDILSLFSKFGFGHLLCRLSLEKHDGISAVQLILSLCLFRINGETIHSIYKTARQYTPYTRRTSIIFSKLERTVITV